MQVYKKKIFKNAELEIENIYVFPGIFLRLFFLRITIHNKDALRKMLCFT